MQCHQQQVTTSTSSRSSCGQIRRARAQIRPDARPTGPHLAWTAGTPCADLLRRTCRRTREAARGHVRQPDPVHCGTSRAGAPESRLLNARRGVFAGRATRRRCLRCACRCSGVRSHVRHLLTSLVDPSLSLAIFGELRLTQREGFPDLRRATAAGRQHQAQAPRAIPPCRTSIQGCHLPPGMTSSLTPNPSPSRPAQREQLWLHLG